MCFAAPQPPPSSRPLPQAPPPHRATPLAGGRTGHRSAEEVGDWRRPAPPPPGAICGAPDVRFGGGGSWKQDRTPPPSTELYWTAGQALGRPTPPFSLRRAVIQYHGTQPKPFICGAAATAIHRGPGAPAAVPLRPSQPPVRPRQTPPMSPRQSPSQPPSVTRRSPPQAPSVPWQPPSASGSCDPMARWSLGKRKRKRVTPPETDVHGDALCFMGKTWARHGQDMGRAQDHRSTIEHWAAVGGG